MTDKKHGVEKSEGARSTEYKVLVSVALVMFITCSVAFFADKMSDQVYFNALKWLLGFASTYIIGRSYAKGKSNAEQDQK